jgi:hypothetical protein
MCRQRGCGDERICGCANTQCSNDLISKLSANLHISTLIYMARRLDKHRHLPVFKKSEELLEMAEAIAEGLKTDDSSGHFAAEIVGNAMLIQVKIAGAEGGGLYSLKMQNAVLIKFAVHDMFNAVAAAAMLEINEDDYVDLMREKVEEFRVEFVEWIRGFDKSYDIPDNWGIRFDTSTPEQEKLEELMFNDDDFDEKFLNDFEDEDFDAEEDDEETPD